MSRIFNTCIEAQKEIERDLFKLGRKVKSYSYQNKVVVDNPDFETIELQGYSYMILNHQDKNDLERLDLEWCRDEFYERINDKLINPGNAYKKRIKVWSEFLVDGKFDYVYNNRIRTQLPQIIEELKKHPSTRQAILEIHNNIIDINNLGGKGRIPCSLNYQFLIRDKKLDIYYTQRSCDFMTHWANDVWQAIMLMRYVAGMINIEPGKLFHFITSFHVYRKDSKNRF